VDTELKRWSHSCGALQMHSAVATVTEKTFAPTLSGFDFAWFNSLSSEHFCVFGLRGAIYILSFLLASFSLPFKRLTLL